MSDIIAVKGFDSNWKCRDYQFAVGNTYTHDGDVKVCKSGFHSIEGNPLEVFGYYPPSYSKYAEVSVAGEVSRHSEESKIAGSEISVCFELTIPELVSRATSYIISNTDTTKVARNLTNWSAATHTCENSVSTSEGNWSAATNTGNWSVAKNTGRWSAATNTGSWSATINNGANSAAVNTGSRSVGVSTGSNSAAMCIGNQSAVMVSGKHSVAAALGADSVASASLGSAIVLCFRDIAVNGEAFGRIIHIKAAIAGQDGIKPDTLYSLDKDGNFVEVNCS